MENSNAFLIISQIYFVGALISNDEKTFLNIIGVFWLIISIIARAAES